MENKENNLNEEFEILDQMHKNQLDDIVLENYEKKERIKKIAIGLASILIIFILVVSIVKVVTDSSNAPQDTLVEEEMMDKLESSNQKSDEGFEELPIINEEKSQEELNKVVEEVKKSDKSSLPKIAQKPLKEAQPTTKQEQTSQNKKAPLTNTVAKEEKSPKKRVTPKTKESSSKQAAAVATGHYYVQVGAFLKLDPDKRFLKKIASHGYNYTIKEYIKNGTKIKRVYIGPFKNRSEAKKELKKIRTTIASGAFIVRL